MEKLLKIIVSIISLLFVIIMGIYFKESLNIYSKMWYFPSMILICASLVVGIWNKNNKNAWLLLSIILSVNFLQYKNIILIESNKFLILYFLLGIGFICTNSLSLFINFKKHHKVII